MLPWAEHSSCFSQGLFIYLFEFFSFVGTRRRPLFSQIMVGNLNHATCNVYLPKAFETLINGNCYFFHFVYNIFSFGFIEVLESKGILTSVKKSERIIDVNAAITLLEK